MSETTNPFTPNRMQHLEALLRGSGYDEDTIEYAARAINMHEKLVAFCSRIASFGFSFDSRDQANGAYRDAVRWLVRDADALLKEEKT